MADERDPSPTPFASGPYFPYPPAAEPPVIPPPLVPIDRNAVNIALLTPADQDALESHRLAAQAASATAFDPRRI